MPQPTAKATGTVGRVLGMCVAVPAVGLWIAIWTAGTLGLDGTLIMSVFQQMRALACPHVEGTVTTSRVIVDSDSEGTTYKAEVTYRYSVGGRKYTGDRLRYGSETWSDSRTANEQVAHFQAGKRVAVYYHPDDPANCLLLPGLYAGQAMTALFATPFNAVMVAGWLMIWEWLNRHRTGRLPHCTRLRPSFDGFELTLHCVSPLAVAAMVGSLAAFLGIFAALVGKIWLPEGPLVAAIWITVIGLAVGMYLRQRRKATVLEVSELRQTFRIRHAANRRPTIEGSLAELNGVLVRERKKRDSDGDITSSYSVTLLLTPAKGRLSRRCLVASWTEATAPQLSDWLTQRLKLREQA